LPELALTFEVLLKPGVDIVLPAFSATFLSGSSCILASLMFITCFQKLKFINHEKFVLQVQIITVAVNQSSNPGIKRGEQYAACYMLIMISLCNLFMGISFYRGSAFGEPGRRLIYWGL